MNIDRSDPPTRPLELRLQENGLVVICIGARTLAEAVQGSSYFEQYDAVHITDPRAFIKEMLLALEQESEDGSTPVHRMLDAAAEYVVEQGGEGIEIKYESEGQ